MLWASLCVGWLDWGKVVGLVVHGESSFMGKCCRRIVVEVVENMLEGSARTWTRHHVAGVQGQHAGYFFKRVLILGAWAWRGLPGAVDVYRQSDQARIVQCTCLADHAPQPIRRFEHMQRGFDAPAGCIRICWHKCRVPIKAHDIAHRTRRPARVIDVCLRVFQQTRDSL